MGRPLADPADHVRQHGPELVKFGIVGGLGTIIDLGGAAVLHSVYHVGPLESKALSITAATIFTYLGSRFWTFRHRENQPVHREALLFVALNVVGLVLAELVIAFTTYGLGLKGPLAYNAASFIGTGLGTVFRWYAYRKWVFLAPAQQPHPQPQAAFAGALGALGPPARTSRTTRPGSWIRRTWTRATPGGQADTPVRCYCTIKTRSFRTSAWCLPCSPPLSRRAIPSARPRQDRSRPGPPGRAPRAPRAVTASAKPRCPARPGRRGSCRDPGRLAGSWAGTPRTPGACGGRARSGRRPRRPWCGPAPGRGRCPRAGR